MPDHRSVRLAREELMTNFDLEAIRAEPMPPRWLEDGWKTELEKACEAAVYNAWLNWCWFHSLGWIEHTNDWDWWIDITTTTGEKFLAYCGSEFQGLEDTDGKQWTDPLDASNNMTGARFKTVHILAEIIPEEDDEDVYHEEWTFNIADIQRLAIGYDT